MLACHLCVSIEPRLPHYSQIGPTKASVHLASHAFIYFYPPNHCCLVDIMFPLAGVLSL